MDDIYERREMKVCSGCGKTTKMWKAKTKERGALCKQCWGAYKSPQSDELPKDRAKVIFKKTIAPVSEKQAKKLAVYRKVRDEYFKEHPTCEYPGCSSDKITLHHAKGRIGDLLTDKRYFKSLCIPHHMKIELEPELAKKLELSYSRLEKI